jgi:hypothetical protein
MHTQSQKAIPLAIDRKKVEVERDKVLSLEKQRDKPMPPEASALRLTTRQTVALEKKRGTPAPGNDV